MKTRIFSAIRRAPGSRHSWLRRPLLLGAILIASFHLLRAEDGPIAAVQEALKKREFYSGEVTGKLDEATRAGLQRFQIHMGLPGTGEMDTSTLQALQGDALPSSKDTQPPDTSDTKAPSGAQSDREFLEQVEKKENGAVPPPEPPARATETVEQSTPPASASREEPAHPKGQQKPSHPRVIEAHAKAPIAERRGESRKEKQSQQSIPDGAQEAQVTRPRALPHTRREGPVQPTTAAGPANASETSPPSGSKVTTVTTTFTGSDGRTYTAEKKITTVPRTPKPFLRWIFGKNDKEKDGTADRIEQP